MKSGNGLFSNFEVSMHRHFVKMNINMDMNMNIQTVELRFSHEIS